MDDSASVVSVASSSESTAAADEPASQSAGESAAEPELHPTKNRILLNFL